VRERAIRVGLAELRWPLDPALAESRDETTVARALYATPLRTGVDGRIISGLCRSWSVAHSLRVWTFRCSHAAAIAAELRRVIRLRASPAHGLFRSVRSITVRSRGTLVIGLRVSRRDFPYALTTVAAAPPGVPGPFRLVRVAGNVLTLRRGSVTLFFRRLEPLAALRAFRRHQLDEAPVPLGDVGALRGSPALRVSRLLAQDVVVFRDRSVPLDVRRAYSQTANRGDYESLVAQNGAPAAFALIGTQKADPAAFRHALARIPSLPPVRVRLAVPDDSSLRFGARLLFGQWREVGLGPRLVASNAPAEADLRRVRAVYPRAAALPGALGLSPADAGRSVRTDATVIPICWVADARVVSPALAGWREDLLGDVDYTRVSTTS
jgi:hypothetical protein